MSFFYLQVFSLTPFFVAVYKFFEQRNVRLRGNPDFAPGTKILFSINSQYFLFTLVVSTVKLMSVFLGYIEKYGLKCCPSLILLYFGPQEH